MNRNPVLNLGIRENRHEQNVNFCKNQVQIIKILGCIVERYFHRTAAQVALKLRRALLQ